MHAHTHIKKHHGHDTPDDLQTLPPANEHSKCQHTTWYAGSGEDSAPQEFSCFRTKASYHFVPSCARNTRVGLQLPPELGDPCPNLVSTTWLRARGLSGTCNVFPGPLHRGRQPQAQNTHTHVCPHTHTW